MDDPLIRSLTTAVEAAPEEVALRVHLAELLLAGGRTDDAVRHAAAALAVDPASEPRPAAFVDLALRGRVRTVRAIEGDPGVVQEPARPPAGVAEQFRVEQHGRLVLLAGAAACELSRRNSDGSSTRSPLAARRSAAAIVSGLVPAAGTV